MRKHSIRFIGYDGKQYWMLFYIRVVDGKDVYYGIPSKKTLALSRHGSGRVNIKIDGKKINMGDIIPNIKYPSLANIELKESLGTWSSPTFEKISKKEYLQYTSKKYDGLFLVDLRNFKGTINIQPYLVNPLKKESLLDHSFNYRCQLFVYTASQPWVAFYVLDVPKSEITKSISKIKES